MLATEDALTLEEMEVSLTRCLQILHLQSQSAAPVRAWDHGVFGVRFEISCCFDSVFIFTIKCT